MPKINLLDVPLKTGSIYPEPYNGMMAGRSSMRLGDAGGLTQFGANITMLEPGARSSMRHWHLNEDEFVMVTSGTVTLIEDGGEVELHPGDCAAFPAGVPDGHCFVNNGNETAAFLVIGTKSASEVATYSDVDMKMTAQDGEITFTRKDGSTL